MVKPIERTRYFDGRLLTSEDFEREQTYLRDRLRRHNRHLHGWGVVHGLQVTLVEGGRLEVSPGLALDCEGNEVAVDEALCVAIPDGELPFYVAVAYAETPTHPVPAGDGVAYTRILEGARVLLLDASPAAHHRGCGPGTPGCGQPHPVALARVRRHRSGWQVRALWRVARTGSGRRIATHGGP